MEMLTADADGGKPTSDVSGYEGRMCVICSGEEFENSHNIFILDFDGAGNDEFTKKSPTLRIEGLGHMCFCVVDSFLYMFNSTAPYAYLSRSGELWMYKYDLRPHLSKSDFLVNSWEMLKESKGPNIHYPKWEPRAIQIPNSKRILLYSQFIPRCYKGKEIETVATDFELFDPSTGWRKLPQLHVIPPSPGYYTSFSFSLHDYESGEWISYDIKDGFLKGFERPEGCGWPEDLAARGLLPLEVGTFINNNTFLVCIPPGMVFTLNIDSPEEGWKVYRDSFRPRWDGFADWDGRHFVDQLMLNPSMVKNSAGCHPFALTDCCPPRLRDWYQLSVLDYVPNQECVTCTVSGGRNRATGYPFLTCDLFKLDLTPTNDDQMEPKPPTRLASFKYDLIYLNLFDDIFVECVCPLAIEEAREEGRGKRARIV